ncbi:hypothetical protein DVH24_012775 [Malus domestica]|uniref:Uncharacterized protein n=1 Tax=Malus domestica TaxID=3750 RepID=A0A498HV98_MALDO|nr:hypothetical protein DVH24_012775 [Malus domestica]
MKKETYRNTETHRERKKGKICSISMSTNWKRLFPNNNDWDTLLLPNTSHIPFFSPLRQCYEGMSQQIDSSKYAWKLYVKMLKMASALSFQSTNKNRKKLFGFASYWAGQLYIRGVGVKYAYSYIYGREALESLMRLRPASGLYIVDTIDSSPQYIIYHIWLLNIAFRVHHPHMALQH